MKILVLPKYSKKGASSRYRFFQYFSFLEEQGDTIEVSPLFGDEYLDCLYQKKNRLFLVFKSYILRVYLILTCQKYDLVWLEKELFPWMPWVFEKYLFELLRAPVVVDYDDAIFHTYDLHRWPFVRALMGNKCDHVLASSACAVMGNGYLAERARRAGADHVQVVPTVVSRQVYLPHDIENDTPVIGWIGSPSTVIYLEKMRPILTELKRRVNFQFHVVGAKPTWNDSFLQIIEWSKDTEVESIKSFDIGIMPLMDSPWERGKCGFKLIQYMACGKPVVADPVGVNCEIVVDRLTGFLANDFNGWVNGLEDLILNRDKRKRMGSLGRERFLENYSLEKWQEPIAELLKASVKLNLQKKVLSNDQV